MQQDGGQPFGTRDVIFWKGHSSSHWVEKVQLLFADGGSCITGSTRVPASLRVCCFPLLPLLQDILIVASAIPVI